MGFSERLLPDTQKLYVKDFDDYLTDVRVFVEKIIKPDMPKKLFILGHSLGGLEALRFIEEYPDDFNGAILSSPLVDMNTGSFPKWLAGLFSGLNVCLGQGQSFATGQGYRIVPEFDKNLNSRDFQRWFLWEKYYVPENPSITLGGANFNWIKVCLDVGNTALKKADKVKIPVLFLQAEDDKIVNPGGMNEAASRIKGCKKVLFESSYHEILMEKDEVRDKALVEIKGFIRKH